MIQQNYNLIAGAFLVIAAIGFFLLPVLIDELDPFLPAVMALIAFLAGIALLVTGGPRR